MHTIMRNPIGVPMMREPVGDTLFELAELPAFEHAPLHPASLVRHNLF